MRSAKMPKRVWQRSKDRKDGEKGQLTAKLCSDTQSMTDEKRKVGKVQESFFFSKVRFKFVKFEYQKNMSGHLWFSAPLRSLVLGGLLAFLATVEPE